MPAFRSETLPRKDVLVASFLLGVFWVVANLLLVHGPSADLMALWLAADAFADGRVGSIYPAETAYFPMLPPEDWGPRVEELDYVGAYYPYVYPPLFAALVSPLTKITDYATFLRSASYVNVFMLLGAIVLAARAARLEMRLPAYIAIALFVLGTSKISMLALHENQPQILVTLLIVLAIERSVAGKSAAAGAALAGAAAIKVYPLLFIFVYAFRRDWRAVAAFAVTGGALGLLSILLAGWPLHAEFLQQLRAISATIMGTPNSYNLNTALATIFATDSLIPIDAATVGFIASGTPIWEIVIKPAPWQYLNTALVLAVVAAFGLAMRREEEFSVTLFVGLTGAVSLLLPLSWAYYFIPLLLFSPMLIERYGKWQGAILLFCAVFPTLIFAVSALKQGFEFRYSDLVAAVAGLIVWILLFTFAPRRESPSRS